MEVRRFVMAGGNSRPAASSSQRAFAARLQSALTVAEVEDAYLAEVPNLLRAAAYGVYRLEPESGEVLGVAATVDSVLLDEYEAYGRQDDPVLEVVVKEGRPIDSSRAASVGDWERCGARDALQSVGLYHSLEAPVRALGALCGTLNFARPANDEAFADRDLLAALIASEQLGLAMERAVRFEATGQRASMLERALDSMPQAMIITDLDGNVLFHNRAAGRSHGALGEAGIRAIEESIGELRRDGRRVATRTIRDNSLGGSFLVRTHRLPGGVGAALSVISQTGRDEKAQLPRWDVLTPRQQEIAQLVSEGLNTKQIAARAFVSENTVKQHIKRIFTKTNVTSRVELLQTIWASAGEAPAVVGDELHAPSRAARHISLSASCDVEYRAKSSD